MTPSRIDISPTLGLDLDERVALEHYYGKSQNEAADMIFEKPEYFADDLMWMGDKAFIYYFPAVEKYIKSERSKSDSVILNSIMTTIKFRMQFNPASIKGCLMFVVQILNFIRQNLNKFLEDYKIDSIAGELNLLMEEINSISER